MADERGKAIELAFAQIEKQFGKGSIMRLGSKEAIVPISVIPTGSISFDAALGVGGFPRGRVVEVFGPESSGNRPPSPPHVPLPRRRRLAAWRHSSMPNTLSILLTQRSWAWMSTTCWFRNLTTAETERSKSTEGAGTLERDRCAGG